MLAQILFHCRVLHIYVCVYVLSDITGSFIYKVLMFGFIYTSVYLLMLTSKCIPPSPSPLVNISLFSIRVSPFLFCKFICIIVSISHITDTVWFLPLLFSYDGSLDPSASLRMAWFHSFSWLSSIPLCVCSVQFSRSIVSDSLQPHESQHARPLCPSPSPGVHSDSRPSSRWCHPAIPSLVIPFSSCPQSLPASESFPMSQPFAWGGQSTGVSASASFPPKKSQGCVFIRWSVSGHLGYFPVLAVVNGAAVNIGVHFVFSDYGFLGGCAQSWNCCIRW